MKQTHIKIDNLFVRYQYKKENILALENISLDIKQGELLVIYGPSGSGKSTLLKAISGLLDYQQGNIFINNVNLKQTNIKELNFSFVFQVHNLYSFASIYQNIALPLKAQKIALDEIEQRVLEVSEQLDISHLLSRRVHQLSGGQLQLVALAKALIKKPAYYLFDEPFSNLDLPYRIKLREYVKNINKLYGSTMVFVTHDINEAIYLADRIIVLEKGRIIEEKDALKMVNAALDEAKVGINDD